MSIFDERIDRSQTASVKWGLTKVLFGADDLLPMWVADMDFKPPKEVTVAIKARAEHSILGYTYVPPSAANAIRSWLEIRHNWPIKLSWLLYTNGIVAAISTAIQAFTKPGDKIMVHSPVYTPFFEMIEKNERVVINSPLQLNEGRYEIDFKGMEQGLNQGAKLLLLCSPHNPVGRVWTRDELLKLGQLCKKHDCLILSDEIHSDIIYEGHRHLPIASLSDDLRDRVITFMAPSKTFNLAGLQASAVIIANEELRSQFDEISKRQGFFTLNTFGIIGMEAAYRHGETWLNELLAYLQESIDLTRSFLQEHLPQITFTNPEGTYLLWLDCRKLSLTDEDIKKRLIEKGKIALEQGIKYGPGGEGFVRLNIACPHSLLIEGLGRLKLALS